jgi:adenosylcobinamide-GDP ribazoletransferase
MRRAVAFLTPFGTAAPPSPGVLDWFPVVGAAMGLAVGGVWWSATKAWSPLAAAAVAVVADVIATGYLHLDGLADAADGLLPPMPSERRLEVMADPSVGAFGAITLVAVLLLRFGALASMRATPLVVGALWCGSRTAMAVTARSMHYARPGGLASAFVDSAADGPGAAGAGAGRARPHPGVVVPGLVGVVLVLVMAILGRGLHGLAAAGGEIVGVGAVLALAQRRIGGFTGDVLGAAGVVGETVGLVVLAAKW